MKKLFALIIVLLLCAPFSGCSKKEVKEPVGISDLDMSGVLEESDLGEFDVPALGDDPVLAPPKDKAGAEEKASESKNKSDGSGEKSGDK